MKYENPATHVEIQLAGLTDDKRKLYRTALEKFRKNADWVTFEEFVFGPMSPVYSGHKSHLEVIADPLYIALEDMWLELGVRQGLVKGGTTQEEKSLEQRRQKSRSRQATHGRNTSKDHRLAPTR